MRIVSLLPSATEILFGIGAGSDVAGITHECDYPPEAQSLPRLTASALPQAARASEIDRHVRKALHQGSSLYSLDSDLLEQLAPDLIVTQELCEVCAVSYSIVDRAVRRLNSDARIVSLEPSSLEDVYAMILTLGELTDRVEGARDLVQTLGARETAVREKVTREKARSSIEPRTLVLEWTDPPMSAGHWTPGLVEAAGGICVLGNPGRNSQTLTWDAIAQADPDAIIVAPCGFDLAATERAIGELGNVPVWNALRAVRGNRVYAVDGNAYVNRPGPRLVDTIEIFYELLHPAG
ncbi:MAG TPA: cobalamin-binding protein [Candidatus Baltobacteraceae bacterium]|jgi:iron complex transport system substrate-binding protein|nr:cobalamin-binding protein [Candidatus Baltobacteraceae bacterium]